MESRSESHDFDSFLGGKQHVPQGLNLSEFIKTRMEEVVMLTEAIQESPFRGQAFQRLPKHMRRRQMSHYLKRLPRRLQRPYLLSLKEGLPVPTKRPSRKYRRKPSNLLIEYNRRQKASVWLETHIWHAKRFHMIKQWGYCLPEKPVNKSFKACYRAISEHCLLIDHSYYSCIELDGPEDELCAGLRRCTAPECGLSFVARMYMSGKREGCTTLFHPDSYPYRVISKVRFLWQSVIEGSARRKIWIWVHPLVHDETIECLKLLFGLSAEPAIEVCANSTVEESEEVLTKKRAMRNDVESVIVFKERTVQSADENIILLEDNSVKHDPEQKKYKIVETRKEKINSTKSPTGGTVVVVSERNFQKQENALISDKDKNVTVIEKPVDSKVLHMNESNTIISNADEGVTTIKEQSSTSEKPLEKEDTGKANDVQGKSFKRKKLRKGKEKLIRKETETAKLEPKNVPFVRTPKYRNQSVTMTSLKDTLNRFELSGPLSHAIVSQAFTVASVEVGSPEVEVMEVKGKRRRIAPAEESEMSWWEAYYGNLSRRKNWFDQKTFYEKMGQWSRPSDVPEGMVLGLVIEDPRLTMPTRREKAEPAFGGRPDTKLNLKFLAVIPQMVAESLPECLSFSPIWEPEVRDEGSLSKLSTEEINEARSRKIVPGRAVTDAFPDRKRSRIPILLVQRPGRGDSRRGKVGLGSGWDIIAPAGFGMPIWLSLILRGARTGGLRESKLLGLECNNLDNFPPPDSAAGECNSRKNLRNLRSLHFKLPPSKRPNYIKLGVLSPFYAPWKTLVENWIAINEPEKLMPEESSEWRFSVLRDFKILKILEEIVRNCPNVSQLEKLSDVMLNCLIPVVIECCGKGKPTDFALISLPSDEDLENLSKTPTEPSHVDENEHERKNLRKEHLVLLKSLRRKRKKEKGKLREMFANGEAKWKDVLELDVASSESHCKEHNEKMEGLWLPDVDRLDNVANSCSRSVLGYVVRGDFSYSRARGVALGYVTVPGLARVLEACIRKKSKAIVLTRNPSDVQYRFGRLSIALES